MIGKYGTDYLLACDVYFKWITLRAAGYWANYGQSD